MNEELITPGEEPIPNLPEQGEPVNRGPHMTSLTAKILTGATVLVAVLLVALTVAVYTVIPQAIQDAALQPVTIANPVDEVTVANPVDEVTVLNPVDTVTVANPVNRVTIANPVDEVRVTNIVETASPRDASLWGYCYETENGGYRISVAAFSGGIEKVVASGSYRDGAAASQRGKEIADYYGYGLDLDFGSASEDCSHLEGWS